MHWREASEQIAAIHSQVLRSELSPAFRAAPTAATAGLAILLMAYQLWIAPPSDDLSFAWQWLTLAMGALLICASDLLYRWTRATRDERRRFAQALTQLSPALLVGAALTGDQLLRADLGNLPALWTAHFGVALWAARQYLPRGMTKVATFYLLGALGLLVLGDLALPARSLAMGALFGCGQAASALYLHRHYQSQRGNLR